jgi:hypothetical protein
LELRPGDPGRCLLVLLEDGIVVNSVITVSHQFGRHGVIECESSDIHNLSSVRSMDECQSVHGAVHDEVSSIENGKV